MIQMIICRCALLAILATIALFALMIYLISRVVILTMNVSDAGVKFIRRWEGSRSAAYHDSAGLLTVGVGHLLTRDELSSGKVEIGAEYVKWRDGLSDEQIDLLLRQDLLRPVTAVNGARLHLRQQEFDALVSFVFNVGVRAFNRSTLLKRLHDGNYADAPAQLLRWVYAGGKRIQGLVNRRQAEANLWRYGRYEDAA